jgi:hypothetical protein
MKENKIFPWIVAIAAASISFSAAFYSIFGIGKMFAGASTNVMVMAASLEFAKLVIASFLYRFWEDVNKALRAYLVIACFILIIITSGGIYGFLSSAYQETANKVENLDKSTAVLDRQKEMIQRQLTQAEKQLEFKNTRQNTLSDMRNRQQSNADNLISQNKSAYSVRTQMNSLGKESKTLDDDIKILQDTISSKNQQISEIETKILEASTNNDLAAEVGPLKYIAKLTGKTLDEVVNWFIIALMLVFDPLAIALVIAANFVFSYTGKNKKEEGEEINNNTLEEIKIIEVDTDSTEKVETEPEKEPEIEDVQEEKETSPQVSFMIGGTPIKEMEEPIDHYFSEEYIDEQFVVEPVEDLEGPKGNNGPDDSTLNEISSEEAHEQMEELEEDIIFSPDFYDDVTYSPDLLTDDENNAIEETVGDESTSETEETQEDGEFGGYKLGNVYKGKKNIKDYENSKDIPLDLLVSKGDPTRL